MKSLIHEDIFTSKNVFILNFSYLFFFYWCCFLCRFFLIWIFYSFYEFFVRGYFQLFMRVSCVDILLLYMLILSYLNIFLMMN